MKNSLLFALSIILVSCTTTPKEPSSSAPIKAENEDDLFTNLSMDLIANPRTQREKDQNTIVSYAIDNTLAVKKTPSGIYYQILKEGKGENPTISQKVTTHYEGKLLNGTIFDSSYSRGEPMTLGMGQVIRGWQEALQLLKPGGKGIFIIPSGLAYGTTGFGRTIQPNEVLLFQIELMRIE